LIRLSLGIGHLEDSLADLERGFLRVASSARAA
jgi:hypothetical protein